MTVNITTLDNGLRIVSETMNHVETVSVGAWVGVGARNETPDLNGVSHLLEHMVFKGTTQRDARMIAEEIEAVGGHMNAYTTREQTAYYAKLLKEDLGLAIDMVSDLVQNATLAEEELERERAVVIQEIHQSHDTPDDIVFDFFQESAFPDQALGRPVLGTVDGIGAMSQGAVCDYLKSNYTAPATVVAAAGNLDHDALVDQVANHFTGLRRNATPHVEAARYQGGEHRTERDLEQVHVLLGFEGLSYEDPDYYAAAVLSTLFGGGMSSRLFQEVREARGLVYSVYSFLSSYNDGGLFGIYAGTGPEEVAELMPVVADEINKVRTHVTEDEVARARAQMKSSVLMSLESTSSRSEQMARQMLLFDRVIPTEEIVADVEAVDVAQVLNVADRLFSSAPTVTAIGPLQHLESRDRFAARLN